MRWEAQAEEAIARHHGGEGRAVDQRELTQLANGAWAAGLCLLMAGRSDEGRAWLRRAAATYRVSWDAGAPAGSWGRPIAALKALLVAGDDASAAARWALDAGAAGSESPIGRYAATLALLVLGDDARAAGLASELRGRDDFPQPVADALLAAATADRAAYARAVDEVLASFERRTEFLEDVRVADTVLALQALAAPRGLAAGLRDSPLLPSWEEPS